MGGADGRSTTDDGSLSEIETKSTDHKLPTGERFVAHLSLYDPDRWGLYRHGTAGLDDLNLPEGTQRRFYLPAATHPEPCSVG